MESPLLGRCLRRLAQCPNRLPRRNVGQQQRSYATPAEPTGDIRAAAPIRFTSDPQQFSQPRAEFIQNDDTTTGLRRQNRNGNSNNQGDDPNQLLRQIRIIPASPSYFTATPQYTDDLLHLSHLLRKYQLLPVLPPGLAPRVAWKTIDQYKTDLAEPIRSKGYNTLLNLLKRLNYIHPSLMPEEVTQALEKYHRDVNPYLNIPKPIEVSAYGVSIAAGRRKSSSATVHLVEGTGECLVNGLPLPTYFGRLHDRESAVWALKSTQRLDKYNVFALTRGGGTTGQAEAITLACAKALLAHEPALKPALRRAGCVTRNMKRVERKKPGKLKARKMPAWVKR